MKMGDIRSPWHYDCVIDRAVRRAVPRLTLACPAPFPYTHRLRKRARFAFTRGTPDQSRGLLAALRNLMVECTDIGRIGRHIIPLIGTRRVKDLTKAGINKVLKDIMAGMTRVSVKTKKLRG
jgi:hypothetical protein